MKLTRAYIQEDLLHAMDSAMRLNEKAVAVQISYVLEEMCRLEDKKC